MKLSEVDKIQVFLSLEMRKMNNKPLENVLRKIVFAGDSNVNWENIKAEILSEYPEKKGMI